MSLEELLLMRCHSRIKKSFTTSLVVLTKPHVMLLHHQVRNKPSNEELSLMVKNFNKLYKSRSKEKSYKSRSYNDKRSSSRQRNCYNCGRPGHYSNECTTPYKRREDSPKMRSKTEESPPRERRSRDDRYERRSSRRSKDSERKDKSSRSYTK